MERPRGVGALSKSPAKLCYSLSFVAWLGAVSATAAFQIGKGPLLQELVGRDAYRLSGSTLEGIAQSVFFVAWALASIFSGLYADRFGRPRALLAAALLCTLGSMATGLCWGWQSLLLARVLTGIGGGAVWGPALALASESVGPQQRARASGFVQTAVCVGHLLIALTNFAFAQASGRVLFFVAAGVNLVALGLAACAARLPHERQPNQGAAVAWRGKAGRMLGPAAFLGFVGVAGSAHVGFWLPNLIQAITAQASQMEARKATSIAMFALQGGALLGILFGAWLCDRVGRRRASALFMLAATASVSLLPFGMRDPQALLLCVPILGFTATGFTGLLAVYLPELFPAEIRAAAAGIAYNSGRIATAGQIALVGILTASSGARCGMAIGALLYLLAFPALLLTPETRAVSTRPRTGDQTSPA